MLHFCAYHVIIGDVPAIAHKYVVRATILRNSWPLSESAWPYISMIKSVEKLEERPGSKPNSARKGKRDKGAGGKKGATPQQSNYNFNQVVGLISMHSVILPSESWE